MPSDAGHGLAVHTRGAQQRRIAEPHVPRLGRGRSRPARLGVGADTLTLIRRRFQAASAATYETRFEGSRVDPSGDVDYRKATIAGTAFWVGVGFQNQAIFADHLGEWWGSLLGNGMTAGGLTAIVLTVFMELTGPRRKRIETALTVEALPEVVAFLRDFASGRSWSPTSIQRLCSADEEALLSLVKPDAGAGAQGKRRLLVIARGSRKSAELEFIAAPGEENLEDRMVLLAEPGGGAPAEHEISLRLLRHHASSVYHQQYHDTDIVTVRVEGDGQE